MLSDAPQAYANQPEFQFIEDVATAWDEMRVLIGDSGEHSPLHAGMEANGTWAASPTGLRVNYRCHWISSARASIPRKSTRMAWMPIRNRSTSSCGSRLYAKAR